MDTTPSPPPVVNRTAHDYERDIDRLHERLEELKGELAAKDERLLDAADMLANLGMITSTPQEKNRWIYGAVEAVVTPRKGRKMEVFLEKDGLTFEEVDPYTDEPCHRYKLNGERVISLTQILDAMHMIDFTGVPPATLKAKAAFGTRVHNFCLWSDQGELDLNDLKPYPAYECRILGWLDFCKDFDFQPDLEWAERPMAVRINGCTWAMKLDRFGMTNQGPAVVEIKTTCDLVPAYDIQTGAQSIPFVTEQRPSVKRFVVQLLDKPNSANKLYYAKECTNRLDSKVFAASLLAIQWRINNKLYRFA